MPNYLSIKENGNLDGLYSFESVSHRDEIARNFKSSKVYASNEKALAKKESGFMEVKDGGILIKAFKKCFFVGLKNTPFDGVYSFVNQKVALGVVEDFKGFSVLKDNKEDICKQFGISEDDVGDGGFLLSGVVKDYLKANKKKVTSDAPSVKAEVKNEDKKKKSLFKEMISSIPSKFNVADITMVNGDVYRITLRNIFYMQNSDIFQNLAFVNAENVPCVKAESIDKLVENGSIGISEKSIIEYKDGYSIIRLCDDVYSPNVEFESGIKITHQIPFVVINTNQIVSIIGKNGYDDVNLTEITTENYKLVYDYLEKKYKKG